MPGNPSCTNEPCNLFAVQHTDRLNVAPPVLVLFARVHQHTKVMETTDILFAVFERNSFQSVARTLAL